MIPSFIRRSCVVQWLFACVVVDWCVLRCYTMSQSVADSFITNKVAPQVNWTAREALDRCLHTEPWTKDIPRIVNDALRIRRSATTRITSICEVFGLSLVWDPALLSIPACSCFKLPAAFHLIYKLRHLVEVLLRLKTTSRDVNIYDRESSLHALRHMAGENLRHWTNLMRAVLDWGKSTMAIIHAAQFRRNVFAPEFLAVFRLSFVPVVHETWLIQSIRRKTCFCDIIAALQHECWSTAHSFVFPHQILYVLCIPFTGLLYAGFSEHPKKRMNNHFTQMNSRYSGSQLRAYVAFRDAPSQPTPIPAANVFFIPVASIPGGRNFGLQCERRLISSLFTAM